MMDFRQAESKFKQLKAQFEAGKLTETEFKNQLEELMVQDEAGSWWMIGFETEQWYRHDGSEWVQADPPESLAGQSPAERETAEKAAREKAKREPAVDESVQQPGKVQPGETIVETSEMTPEDQGATVVESTPPSSAPATEKQKKILGLSLPVLAIGGIGLIIILGAGIFGVISLFSGGPGSPAETEEPTVVVTVTNTDVPTATRTPVATATRSEPLETPTQTAVPYTPTPETPYVIITNISINSNNFYVVDYETHNFPSDSPKMHVHMFFNTVPPDQAGSPGSGPWKLTWGPYGDHPFVQYGISNRPAGATQMCALVANPNHTVQPNSGNCMDLPEN